MFSPTIVFNKQLQFVAEECQTYTLINEVPWWFHEPTSN